MLHQPSKLAGLSYMEQTGTSPSSRSVQALMDIRDERFGKTDTERSWAWLNQLTEFTRTHSGNLKDIWARFLRTATRLETLGMKMSAEMIYAKAIQALKLTDTQLPVAISALGTKQKQ